MRAVVVALLVAAQPLPALAQEAEPPGDMEEGRSLVEEGARLFLRGLLSEMEPALRDMAEGMEMFAENVEPILRDLAALIDDVANYHAPEILPNGDIIIRRRQPGEVQPGGEVDI